MGGGEGQGSPKSHFSPPSTVSHHSPGRRGCGGGRARDSMKSCWPWCFTRCTSLQICWKVTCGTQQGSRQHWGTWPLPGTKNSTTREYPEGPGALAQGGKGRAQKGERTGKALGLAGLILRRTGAWAIRGIRKGGLLTGAGGPGPSASPPLLSLEEPGLRRGPGDATGPTPQSPVGLELCTGYSRKGEPGSTLLLSLCLLSDSHPSRPQFLPATVAGGSAPRAPGYQSPRTELSWSPGE